MNDGRIVQTTLYASTIAFVSGGYSGYLAMTGMEMGPRAWLMLLVGVVVVAHGLILLTPLADRLGRFSGPLMAGYAVVMLLIQAWMALEAMDAGMMEDPMGADAGMVALAVLMLASGLIMTGRGDM